MPVTFSFFILFVEQIPREPLNGLAPNSHGRRVWSLARMNLNVKVKGQRSRSAVSKNALCTPVTPDSERMVRSAAWRINALAVNNVTQKHTEPFRRCRGWLQWPVYGLRMEKHLFLSISVSFQHFVHVKQLKSKRGLSSNQKSVSLSYTWRIYDVMLWRGDRATTKTI